jgi:hypothetical protein
MSLRKNREQDFAHQRLWRSSLHDVCRCLDFDGENNRFCILTLEARPASRVNAMAKRKNNSVYYAAYFLLVTPNKIETHKREYRAR